MFWSGRASEEEGKGAVRLNWATDAEFARYWPAQAVEALPKWVLYAFEALSVAPPPSLTHLECHPDLDTQFRWL